MDGLVILCRFPWYRDCLGIYSHLFKYRSKLCCHIPLWKQPLPLPLCFLLVLHRDYLHPGYGPPVPLQGLAVHCTALRYRHRPVDQSERKPEGSRKAFSFSKGCKCDTQRSAGSTSASVHVFSGLPHSVTKIEHRYARAKIRETFDGRQICE